LSAGIMPRSQVTIRSPGKIFYIYQIIDTGIDSKHAPVTPQA